MLRADAPALLTSDEGATLGRRTPAGLDQVCIPCAGPSNLPVTCMHFPLSPSPHPSQGVFRNVSTEAYQDGVGASVLALVGIVPDGVLLFFPSYSLLERLTQRWQVGTWWMVAVLFPPLARMRVLQRGLPHSVSPAANCRCPSPSTRAPCKPPRRPRGCGRGWPPPSPSSPSRGVGAPRHWQRS